METKLNKEDSTLSQDNPTAQENPPKEEQPHGADRILPTDQTETDKKQDVRYFIVDMVMVVLVLVNLLWIVFDWFFLSQSVKDFLLEYLPAFFTFYHTKIHNDFMLYDSIFVSVFILELLIRWIVAIKKKTYYKWFFYPFIHWYDVLGCIPIGAFRALRVLRVISIVFRLHKIGLINLKNTYFFKLGKKYYNILVEEVSDRVVINVLDGVKEEIEMGSPVTDRMISEIIKPQQDVLSEWIAQRVKNISLSTFSKYDKNIRLYVNRLVGEAFEKNLEINTIQQIPLVGNMISKTLDHSVSDIVYSIIEGIMADIQDTDNNRAIEETVNAIIDNTLINGGQINEIARGIVMQVLDLVKEQVAIKQWKIKEEATIANKKAITEPPIAEATE